MLDKIVMQAFVAVADHSGLRRLVPEDAVPADVLGVYARGWFPRPTTVVWALPRPRRRRGDSDGGGCGPPPRRLRPAPEPGRRAPLPRRGQRRSSPGAVRRRTDPHPPALPPPLSSESGSLSSSGFSPTHALADLWGQMGRLVGELGRGKGNYLRQTAASEISENFEKNRETPLDAADPCDQAM